MTAIPPFLTLLFIKGGMLWDGLSTLLSLLFRTVYTDGPVTAEQDVSLRPSQFTRLSFDSLHWLRFFSEVVER